MTKFIHSMLPASRYNLLPLIADNDKVPEEHQEDLEFLQSLLKKHEISSGVSIRLIHKHFDANEGEVMVFDTVTLPGQGSIQTMKPVLATPELHVKGMHYFVDSNNDLQAYEYTTGEVPNIGPCEAFMQEFCSYVASRSLQSKFGLKMANKHSTGESSWTEYEMIDKRVTIMFPGATPVPQAECDDNFTVCTEWGQPDIDDQGPSVCNHSTKCSHCTHCPSHRSNNQSSMTTGDAETGYSIGGHLALPGTPLYKVIHSAIGAAA
ncbi:hypothetical protein NLG97_g4709 [Lecanicillium saksenae]|uniref:Uncharacterized protein n=1 Tax=Lecanicillium saksenae TaxID=468837 RepID=A0ACC1QW91_9HYPO|nr:hypothetical protein NLG97_g4709 [Lecanicillium saksenae]